MADYKGQTRTPYTNALEAARKAQESSLASKPAVDIPVVIEQAEVAVEQPKKRGRPAKEKV